MIEHAAFPLCEVRAKGKPEAMSFQGYGACFNNLDAYEDIIAPGAFTDTLSKAKTTGNWPAMLLQHGGGFLSGTAEDMTPIGVWTSMTEDRTGLAVEGKLANTARGRDIYELLTMEPRPALNGLSIGFMARGYEYPDPEESDAHRIITKCDLLEVSVVTFPANPQARIDAVKAYQDALAKCERLRDFEEYLRERRFSRNEATAFVSRLKATVYGDRATAVVEMTTSDLQRLSDAWRV